MSMKDIISGFKRHCVYIRLTITLFLTMGMLSTPAFAQQRTFFNGGFEQNDPRGPGTPSFQIFNDNAVDEWSSTTNEIELWDDGFRNTPAYEGDVFAEMNANVAGTLFQEVCLISGETVEWFFAHRARPGGPNINPQQAVLEVADLSGNLVQFLAAQSTDIADGWQTNSGSTNFSGPTGIYRVQFRSTNPGSFGNFIDALTLNISSFAVLSAATGQSFENDGNNIPSVTINGLVETDTSIPINVIGGTATAGDDFTQTSPNLVIPAGLYFDVEFPLPLTINNNNDIEPDETIIIQLGAPSSPEVIFENTACDGSSPQTSAVYTIVNDDTSVSANKTVASFDDGTSGEYSIPGNDVIYTITAANTGPIDVDSDTIFLVDTLPSEVAFFNGDIDGSGPETDPIAFTSSDPNLTLNYPADVGFSTSPTPPSSMAECSDTPIAGYDPAIRHICFRPQGTLSAGDPDPSFSVSFRAGIQ